MTEIQLTAGAIEQLKALAQKTGQAIPNSQEMQCLWDAKFVMGSNSRAHITAQGKKLILQLMQEAESPT